MSSILSKNFKFNTLFYWIVHALALCVILVIFLEDFIRMNLDDLNIKIYLIKDFLILFGYFFIVIFFILNYKHLKLSYNVTSLMVYIFCVSVIFCVSTYFNFNSFSLIFLGIRTELFYWIFVLMIMFANQNRFFFSRLIKIIIFFVITNIIVAFLQFFDFSIIEDQRGFQGIYELLDVQRQSSFKVIGEPNVVWNYLYGTFTDVSKLNSNLYNSLIWLILFYILYNKLKLSTVLFLSFCIVITLFFSGKRIYLIFSLGLILFLIISNFIISKFIVKNISSLNKNIFSELIFFTSIIFCFLIVILFFYYETVLFYSKYIFYIFTNQVFERLLSYNDFKGLTYEINQMLKDSSYIIGNGIGLSTSGKQYIDPNIESLGFEFGPTKMWYELGILGLFQFIMLWSIIFYLDFRAILKLRYFPQQCLGSLIIFYFHTTFFVSFIFGHHYWDDSQNQIHFWGLTGIQFFLINKYCTKKNNNTKILV